jgi:hypothetical protein
MDSGRVRADSDSKIPDSNSSPGLGLGLGLELGFRTRTRTRTFWTRISSPFRVQFFLSSCGVGVGPLDPASYGRSGRSQVQIPPVTRPWVKNKVVPILLKFRTLTNSYPRTPKMSSDLVSDHRIRRLGRSGRSPLPRSHQRSKTNLFRLAILLKFGTTTRPNSYPRIPKMSSDLVLDHRTRPPGRSGRSQLPKSLPPTELRLSSFKRKMNKNFKFAYFFPSSRFTSLKNVCKSGPWILD